MKKILLAILFLVISFLLLSIGYKYSKELEDLTVENKNLIEENEKMEQDILKLEDNNHNLNFSTRNYPNELFYGEWELTGKVYFSENTPTSIERLILNYDDYTYVGIYPDKLTLDGAVVVERPIYRTRIEPIVLESEGEVKMNPRYNEEWELSGDNICFVFTYDYNALDHIANNTQGHMVHNILGNVFYIKDKDTLLFDIGNHSTIEAKRVQN